MKNVKLNLKKTAKAGFSLVEMLVVIAVIGAVIISVTRPRDLGHWRSWALLLPLALAALMHVSRVASAGTNRMIYVVC